MRLPFRQLRRAGFAAAATALAVTAAAGSAAATPTVDYVNLGDSYSAGSGVLPVVHGSYPPCLQSTLNFAHDIAAARGYSLTDVSCGGAQTKDYTGAQYPGLAPQLDAVSPTTQLITMTIGGNDNNVFIGSIAACGSAGLATLGQGSPCKDTYGDSFANTVRTSTYANLVNALTAVRAKAPHARIAISGYPEIVPPTVGCYPQMPLATGDVPYVYDLERTLNATVAKAAAATGVTFVDQSAVSTGHDACQAPGTRWVEPALFTTQFVPVHPNALGEQGMAAQITKSLNLH